MTDEKNEDLKTAYQQLCESYRAIDDFRTKLLGFLPLATGTGLFVALNALSNQTQQYLKPIGAFGLAITLGLFCFELYGIKKCTHLILAGRRIERQLDVRGQFLNRPPGVIGLINEPFAAGIIYPATGTAWMFLLIFGLSPPQTVAWPLSIQWWIVIAVFVVGLVVSVFYSLWSFFWLKNNDRVLCYLTR